MVTTTLALALLAACNQTAPNASGSPTSTTAVATTGAASPSLAGRYVDLRVVVPEPNSNVGIDGAGWTVDAVAKGNGPAMDRVRPAFRASTSTGRNPAFPGLVVLIRPVGATASPSPSASAGGGQPNLAGLFQTVGLTNTNATASTTTTSASPTVRPSASASASGGASGSPSATSTTSTTVSGNTQTAEATWFVTASQWGTNVDVELTAFVVDGDAPDTVPADRSSLKIISNEVTVRFHINGGGTSPAGTARPSGSAPASPSGSASPSGTARPSGSP